MKIEKIGVLGAGTMGSGIALVAAQAGFQVVMRDVEERFVSGGLGTIDRFLTRSVEKQKITIRKKKSPSLCSPRLERAQRVGGCRQQYPVRTNLGEIA